MSREVVYVFYVSPTFLIFLSLNLYSSLCFILVLFFISLAFQWTDIDMYDGDPLKENPRVGYGVPGVSRGAVPIQRMYGVTGDGHSVCCHIHGFTPYFWTVPPADMTEKDIPAWQQALEAQLAGSRAKSRIDVAIPQVQLVPEKQSLLGYHFNRKQNMLKVYTTMPNIVPTAKGVLERGLHVPGLGTKSYLCFEANVPFSLRFMIDSKIVGCNWCEAPAGTYALRPMNKRVTTAQIEIDIVYDSLISHEPEGVWQRIAPLRILSFDIECMGRKGYFPEAEHDPVIQIANVVTQQGSSKSIVRNVFTFGSCSPIVGAGVHSYTTEQEMLAQWSKFVVEADPDIITGYNVQNFDLPYLLNRMKALKVDDAFILGRIRGVKATMKDTTFQSSAYGKMENVET